MKFKKAWLIALVLFFSVALIAPSCVPLTVAPTTTTDSNNDKKNETNKSNTSKGKK